MHSGRVIIIAKDINDVKLLNSHVTRVISYFELLPRSKHMPLVYERERIHPHFLNAKNFQRGGMQTICQIIKFQQILHNICQYLVFDWKFNVATLGRVMVQKHQNCCNLSYGLKMIEWKGCCCMIKSRRFLHRKWQLCLKGRYNIATVHILVIRMNVLNDHK